MKILFLILIALTSLSARAKHVPLEDFENEQWYYHYSHFELEKALPALEAYLQEHEDELPALGYYAETLHRLRFSEKADSVAARCNKLDRRWGRPYAIRGAIRKRQYGTNDLTDSLEALKYYRKALSVRKPDNSTWEVLWIEGITNRDRSLEKEALEGLYKSKLYPESLLEMGRWILESLPDSAILITGGDRDTYPLAVVQQCENIRPDVVIANSSLLNVKVYITGLEERYGIVPRFSESALMGLQHQLEDGKIYTIAHQVMMKWMNDIDEGELKRPFCHIASFGIESVHPSVQSRFDGIYNGAFTVYGGQKQYELSQSELQIQLNSVLSKNLTEPYLDMKREFSPVMINAARRAPRGFEKIIILLGYTIAQEYLTQGDEESARKVVKEIDAHYARVKGVTEKDQTAWKRAVDSLFPSQAVAQ